MKYFFNTQQWRNSLLSFFILSYLSGTAYLVHAQGVDVGKTTDVFVHTNPILETAKQESQQTTILTQADIMQKAAKSVEDIIFSEPGAVRSVDAMGRVTLSIRGAEPRHTLILVDGQPVLGDLSKYMGAGDELSRLGTDNVDHIEYIQGAASAKYGSDAIGGVINVVTKGASKKAGLTVRLEGRRIAGEKVFPYKNYFLRADSGIHGKWRTAIYSSRRDIAPVYSEKIFRGAMNWDGDFRSSLRYYGDIKTAGALATYDVGTGRTLHLSTDTVREDMKRLVKHTEDSPEPVVTYTRNIKRNTYQLRYDDNHLQKTDWHVEMNFADLRETDLAIGSNEAFSKYEGKNTLAYLDTLKHTQKQVKIFANTQLNAKHMLTYGIGSSVESGSGARVKNAPKQFSRQIDPWDYDKNLYTVKGAGSPSSRIHEWAFSRDEEGIPGVDLNFEYYGYRKGNKGVAPAYTIDDYEKEEHDIVESQEIQADREKRKKQFAMELRNENGKRNSDILDADDWDDDKMMRRYYAYDFDSLGEDEENFPLTWHGKKFREENKLRQNRITIGEASISKKYAFLQDLWQVNEGMIISPSIRLDHSSVFGSTVTFNVGMTKQLSKDGHTQFKANIGTGYTEPGMGELYYNWEMYRGVPYDMGVGKLGFYWIGNPNLKPERSINVDASWEKDTKDTSTKVTIFHNRISDYMSVYFTGKLMHFRKQDIFTWMNPPDMIYSFKNIGRAEITGVEAAVTHRWNEHWKSKLGYTYLQARNKSDADMPKKLLNKPSHKIDASITYTNKQWRVSLWGDYYIHMLDSNTVSGAGNYVELTDEFHVSPADYKREKLLSEPTVPDPKHKGKRGYHELEYKFSNKKQQTYKEKTFGVWNVVIQKQINNDTMVYAGIDNLFNHRDDDQAMAERNYKIGFYMKLGGTDYRKVKSIPSVTMSTYKGNPYWFIETGAISAADTLQLTGSYRLRWNAFTGRIKPTEARVTTQAAIGSAYKNYIEKGEHGFEQELQITLTAPLSKQTYITLSGKAHGVNKADTTYDISPSRGINKQEVTTGEVVHQAQKWNFSVGRLAEAVGTSGYWFNQAFDGVRAVWTKGDTQVRLGYGDFSGHTGVADSAYSRAVPGVFKRTFSKKEWLGINNKADIVSETYTHNTIPSQGEDSLYEQLSKAKTFEEEKQVFAKFEKIIERHSDNSYETAIKPRIHGKGSVYLNSYMWEKITITDTHNKGKQQTFLAAVIPLAYLNADKWGDKKPIEDTLEKAFLTTENNIKNKPLQGDKYLSKSGIVKNGRYTFKSEFYGYGTYTGEEVLQDLGIDYMGRRGVIPWDKVKEGQFKQMSRNEALQLSKTSAHDHQTAWEQVYALRNNEVVTGYTKAHVSPIMKGNLETLLSAWKPEDNSSLPLKFLEQEGYIREQRGIILETSKVPALQRAAFVQVKRQVNDWLGVQGWYLRSTGDSAYQITQVVNFQPKHKLFATRAEMIGLGAKIRLYPDVILTAEWGMNHTALGRYLNGTTIYDHTANSNIFRVKEHSLGDNPYFMVYRIDIGQLDMDRQGSWNAFLDYKYFMHGSFFGGNGTETLPDRYLDGIQSFTAGARYMATKHMLLEGFYTFGAKGIQQRDSLYGAERFTLGDYVRIQGTYRF